MRSSFARAWLVSARALAKSYAKLIELDFTRELAVDTDDDAVFGLEVLNFLVGVARLLAQLTYPLLQPDAGATGRFEFGLQLIFDVGIGKGVGDRWPPCPGRAKCMRSARCSCVPGG